MGKGRRRQRRSPGRGLVSSRSESTLRGTTANKSYGLSRKKVTRFPSGGRRQETGCRRASRHDTDGSGRREGTARVVPSGEGWTTGATPKGGPPCSEGLPGGTRTSDLHRQLRRHLCVGATSELEVLQTTPLLRVSGERGTLRRRKAPPGYIQILD